MFETHPGQARISAAPTVTHVNHTERNDYLRRLVITPIMAAAWLKGNTLRNRAINQHHVKRIAEDIRRGAWECNGETIILDPQQNILDGQHRLRGILVADRAIESYVVFNMDPAYFHTIDQSKVRTFGQVLSIGGEENASRLAAALHWVYLHDQGKMESSSPTDHPSRAQLEDTLARHPRLRDSLHWGRYLGHLLPPGLTVALHYLCHQRQAAQADAFFTALRTGTYTPEQQAVYLLRERLIRTRQSKARLPTIEQAALVIKAWNATVLHSPVRYLRWRTKGEKPEDFPRIETGT